MSGLATTASLLLVADLSRQDDRPSSIRFQNINSFTVEHDILGFHVVHESPLSGNRTDEHPLCRDKHTKAIAKGKRAALSVEQLLNGNTPANLHADPSAELPSMCTGDMAFVGGPPCEGHARDLEGITSFQQAEFRFPESSACRRHCGFTSTQYLHFSCPSLKAEERLVSEHGIPTFDHVEIVSGVCLFSAGIVRGSVLEDGCLDVQKLLYPKPTLYEMDYIARSSPAIADVASIIMLRGAAYEAHRQHGFTVPVSISLDVPSFHYYQAIDESLVRGVCTASEALRWLEAVEQRSDQVATVFEKAVRHELGKRGVSGCRIHVSPRTSVVAAAIRQALENGKCPCLDDILQKLNSQKDGVWREFYKLLPPKERPQDFRALGYLFYVFQVVKPALMKSAIQSRRKSTPASISKSSFNGLSQPWACAEEGSRPRRLLISIDDGAERRIYSRAQKMMKKIRNSPESMTYPNLVETYLSRKVFINGNVAGSNLYLDDPTPESPVMSRLYRRDGTDGSLSSILELKPVDVVRHLYGYECAGNLNKWFLEVGL